MPYNVWRFAYQRSTIYIILNLIPPENAALHGSGTGRVLGKSDFALFDCTASLHGYYSDVTRVLSSRYIFNFSVAHKLT